MDINMIGPPLNLKNINNLELLLFVNDRTSTQNKKIIF